MPFPFFFTASWKASCFQARRLRRGGGTFSGAPEHDRAGAAEGDGGVLQKSQQQVSLCGHG